MIYILMPAFNEEDSLPPLMEKIIPILESIQTPYHLIICDDGSTDNTNKLLNAYKEKIPLTIIEHVINRGLGESSRDLFEKAAELSSVGDVIIRLDCDDTHEPQYIPSIIDKLSSGCDVVIASRFEAGGGQLGVSPYRAFISRSANLFMKVFFPIKGLKEYSCGFRGYKAEIIKEAINYYGNEFISLKGLGFTCTLEKIVKLKLIGARFGEVPFILRYDQKVSSSKMVSSVTTLGYLIMTILYHWPRVGWRASTRRNYKDWKVKNSKIN